MPRRKIRDYADAHACLAAAAASGLPRAAWARANSIDARSLNAWRITLERKSTPSAASPPRLVELVPLPPPRSTPYVVHCGPMTVEVAADFDDDVLRRLLTVVASC
jgi:hypothetical protein